MSAPEIENTSVPPLNCAVFTHSNIVGLVNLGTDTTDRDAAEAAASGYAYAGSIGVNDGVPKVECEPGCESAMFWAGYQFAGLLGEHLKRHQLAQQPPQAADTQH